MIILTIEFSKRLREEQHYSITEAAVEACRVRLRLILMTAFAFIFGVMPLVFASGAGAGAASRHSLGTTVFGGMLAATIMSLLLVPVFFVWIEKLREKLNNHQAD